MQRTIRGILAMGCSIALLGGCGDSSDDPSLDSVSSDSVPIVFVLVLATDATIDSDRMGEIAVDGIDNYGLGDNLSASPSSCYPDLEVAGQDLLIVAAASDEAIEDVVATDAFVRWADAHQLDPRPTEIIRTSDLCPRD